MVSVLGGCDALQFPEGFCKKAQILETAGMCDGGYLLLCGNQQVSSLLNAVLAKVLNRCKPHGGAEATQTLTFADGCTIRNFGDCDFFRVMFVNELEHYLDPLGIPQRFQIGVCNAGRKVAVEQQNDL